jgi:hypothetical protein
MGISKIWNFEYKYKVTRTQFPRKTNGAQSSINKMFIPPKKIGSWVKHLVNGPWRNSHDPRPIMSPHTCIIFLLKPTKKIKRKKKKVLFVWSKKVDDLYMRTKCPKQHEHLPRKKDRQYAPHLKIKPHPKNTLPSLDNPLAHLKCINHLWPKCNAEEFLCLKRSFKDSKACTLTLWP